MASISLIELVKLKRRYECRKMDVCVIVQSHTIKAYARRNMNETRVLIKKNINYLEKSWTRKTMSTWSSALIITRAINIHNHPSNQYRMNLNLSELLTVSATCLCSLASPLLCFLSFFNIFYMPLPS